MHKEPKTERQWVMLTPADRESIEQVAAVRWDNNLSAALRWLLRIALNTPEVQAILEEATAAED